MNTIHRITHIVCFPWLAILLLWVLMWVPVVGGFAMIFFSIFQNYYAHEFSGRVALGISMVTLVHGFFTQPHSKRTLAWFVAYAIVLVLFAAWTAWWQLTNQPCHFIGN